MCVYKSYIISDKTDAQKDVKFYYLTDNIAGFQLPQNDMI